MEDSRGTILVTGGAGFIGTAIAPLLLHSFGRVVVVDNLHPQIHPGGEASLHLPDAVELHIADVADASTWDRVLRAVTPDVVIHLAAETGTGQSLTESSRHAHVNVVGTTQMLDGLARNDSLPHRLVLTSSRAVYGEGSWRRHATGEAFHPPQRTSRTLAGGQWDYPGAEPIPMNARVVQPAPVSIYGATKLAQEHLVRIWSNSFGVESVVVRLQNVYGPGQSLSNPYTGIMSLFCRMARLGKSIPLYEDGEVRRDFILIDDVASAVVAASTVPNPPAGPVDIGSGEHQTIGTAARLIADYYAAPAPHVTGQYREGDVRHAWADISDARELLGWEPRFTLEQGIRRLADWIEAQDAVPEA